MKNMANRRMFSNRIAGSARFLQMPLEAQALYFHLILNADDDGIVEAYPITKLLGTSPDVLKVLLAKSFIQQLNEDQVMILNDWSEHNSIRADRKIDSIYKKLIPENVELVAPKPRSDVKDNSKRLGGPSMDGIGKVRLGKVSRVIAQKEQLHEKPFKRLKKDKQRAVHRLGYYLEDVLKTNIVNWGKQAKAVKAMEKAGYTENQIKKVIYYMATSDNFFSDKGFDLTTVSNQIGRYKAQSNKNGISK